MPRQAIHWQKPAQQCGTTGAVGTVYKSVLRKEGERELTPLKNVGVVYRRVQAQAGKHRKREFLQSWDMTYQTGLNVFLWTANRMWIISHLI